MGRWEDAQFYATPDEMVVQFVEAAYPDALDGILLEQEKEKEKLEQEKVRCLQ